MARFEFKMSQGWEQSVNKLGNLYDETIEDMLKAGARVVADRIKSASKTFAKYVKIKKPKKNQYGWFARVYFSGKTSSGTPAALAANVYEFGRGGTNEQPARPFIRTAIQSCEREAAEAMQAVLDEALKKV